MDVMAESSSSQAPASSSSSSSSEHIRQEQIDQLRNRVDNVLKNLIKSAITDTQSLKHQVNSLRGDEDTTAGGDLLGSDNQSMKSSDGSISGAPTDDFLGLDNNKKTLPVNSIMMTTLNNSNNTSSKTTTVTKKQWVVDPYGDQGDYQGELNEDSNLPHGFGVMKYSDGRIFAGHWKNGRWHGNGQATFSNGDTFEGTYYEDQRHGQGEYKWIDGREYSGGFVNDQRSGQGKYTWPDGATYTGEFSKGLRHGTGTYTVSCENQCSMFLFLFYKNCC
jgi:hypothetical protein